MYSDRILRSFRIGLLIAVAIPGIQTLACSIYEEQSDQSSDEDHTGANDAGNPSDRLEQWVYVDVPHFGLAPLQAVLEAGTQANSAWLEIGEPIEHYESIALHAPNATVNNGALVVRMLPERCLGDFNNNGQIDLEDVAAFTDAYVNDYSAADLTGDSIIDIRDQILFLHLATIPCHSAW